MPAKKTLFLTLLAFLIFASTLTTWRASSAWSQEPKQAAASITSDKHLYGFLESSRADHLRFEDLAVQVPTPARARKLLRVLTEEPHVAGTPEDYETALYVRDQLREMGIDAELVEYRVLLNYPEHVAAKMTVPQVAPIPLREPGNVRDKDSFSHSAFPGFHGYGASGKAAGQIVYVNYGRPEDFKKLDELGVRVKGRIVLARYGKIFRGLKVQNAEERGAAGVLIYSDPADDGYMKGGVYPDGPFRPEWAIQRGSVHYLSLGPGDPSTPGWASTAGAKRVDYNEQVAMPRTPSLPLSYGAARPILKALAGQEVPDGWQGGLPFAYHVGPGPAEVEFEVEMDYAIRPIWNVMGKITGHEEPDQWVLISNHRDAWTYGAVDPNSGSVAFLETARALAAALEAGWEPRRSILFASWDAEEYGLVGSTEWAEEHAEMIGKSAVLILNVDSAVAGPNLDLGGTPSVRDLVLSAAAYVTDPRDGEPLAQKWRKNQRRQWADSEPIVLDHPDPPFVPQLRAIGSGSDYTVFLDHLGVPVLDVDFRGHYGVYHSLYDNFFWMEKFGDPEFLYHTTAARLYTRILMRAASAELLPMRFGPYGAALAAHRDDLKRRVIRKRRVSDEDATRKFDFSPLDEAVARFHAAADALDRALEVAESLESVANNQLAETNQALAQIERRLLDADGLPGRQWFRHLVYAPGLTTGYASWPMPGLRQAIEQSDPALFEQEMPRLVGVLDAATKAMETANGQVVALGSR